MQDEHGQYFVFIIESISYLQLLHWHCCVCRAWIKLWPCIFHKCNSATLDKCVNLKCIKQHKVTPSGGCISIQYWTIHSVPTVNYSTSSTIVGVNLKVTKSTTFLMLSWLLLLQYNCAILSSPFPASSDFSFSRF